MLKPKYIHIAAVISAMTLAATAGAQVLIGGFQGAGDPTDAGWVNPHTGNPITTDPADSFVAAGVTGYAQSLQVNGIGFGGDEVELQFSAAQITAFTNNSWITFTFSVPGGTYTGGYSQIYNLALNAPGYGYNNQAWTNAVEMGNTNNTTPGSDPNFYFSAGSNSLRTMVVSLNYSSVVPAIQAGIANSAATNGPSFLQMTFQGNLGGGAPTNIFLNAVVLSQGPFGQVAQPTANVFIVDNFSTNGVGPENPINDDYYTSSNNYASGQITNVYWNWFGGAFSNTAYAPGVSPPYAPSQGSLAINLDWVGGGAAQQFELWNQGPTNDFYSVNLSALTYTNFSCDVMYAPGSATNSSGTFGLLQFGNRPPGYGQDYFGGGNNGITVNGTNAGVWQHVSIALNALTDTNLLNIQGILIHTYDGGGTITGPSTIYVDNIEFSGPLVVTKVPPPTVAILPAVPGLRMFVGSSATYIREGVITTQGTGENESWVGASGPVTYSFQLLSYPPAGIGVTELAILPEASFNTTANFQKTIYNNPFLDFQDSNGFYVVIAPHGGSVTAAVQWKVGLPSPSGAMTNLVSITNSTAIGTWTLTMNSATSGSLTAPGGQSANFSFSDPNVASDFANPTVATVFEEPGSSAGYGLYEDIGTISISGTVSAGGTNNTENFANETNDFTSGTSPGGFFQNNYSVDPGNLVISRVGLDKYWVNWTAPATGFYLVTDTNLSADPTNWIAPIYFSGYNPPDITAPRGGPTQFGSKYWTLLPDDDLPTSDGGFQATPPTITDPLSPNAFFMLTTNTAFIHPVIP